MRPDAFDAWPLARVEREIEILQAIRNDGDDPLTSKVFVETLAAIFSGD